MTVAVIRFPGSNCEDESIQALTECGVSCRIVEWTSDDDFNDFTGFLLPGGFSYQDRIRAGVIAAKLPLMNKIKGQAKQGKPILGICNGAQILVESGVISSGSTLDEVIDFNMAEHQPIGFVSDWGFLRPFNAKYNRFLSSFTDNDVLPIQICHGEGRFIFSGAKPHSGVVYVSMLGEPSEAFPITPNGSAHGIAGVSNRDGNVLAIMPHPERSNAPLPLSIKTAAKKNGMNLVNAMALMNGFKQV
jgi:phosphoribosylformylglycinamidine synthase I